MKQQFLFSVLALTLVSCGIRDKSTSTIKNSVKATSLAETYGDGTFIYPELFLPLTEISEVPSQVPNAGPVFSGIARAFMNIGVGLGMGKANMTVIQPLPDIPREYVKDIRVKRVFFYIEPKKGEERKQNFVRRILKGKGDVDFDFLGKMAILVKPHHMNNRKDWVPLLNPAAKPSERLEQKFEDLFDRRAGIYPEYVDSRQAPELVLLKYDQSRKKDYIKNDEYGPMFIAKANQPYKVRTYLRNHPDFKALLENVFVLEDTLVIELKKDELNREAFLTIYNNEKDLMDQDEQHKISFLEECTTNTCMDLRIPEVSLIDIITRDNAIRLDAFVEASEVPETFRLKGFIQFKTKVKPPI